MKLYNYIKLAIFAVFSVLIIVYANNLLHSLQYFIGSLMVAFGLENVIVPAVLHKKKAIKEIKFLYGFLEVALGIMILAVISNFVVICVMWSTWSIMREIFEIHEIFTGKIKGSIAVVSFIESVIVFVFSFMLIITPTEHHASSHIYLLIAELLITGFSPVFDEMVVVPISERIKKRHNKQKVDNNQN